MSDNSTSWRRSEIAIAEMKRRVKLLHRRNPDTKTKIEVVASDAKEQDSANSEQEPD